MKRIITLILAATLMFSMTACGKEVKNPNASDIMATIRKNIEFPDMGEVKKETLNIYYDIKVDQIDQVAYIIAGSGITTDEVIVLKMKDKTDMADIRKKLEARLSSQTDLFKSYASKDELSKLDSAIIEVKGNYAILAITKDNSKAKKIFNKSF